MVPRSGCTRMSTAGTAAIASMPTTSTDPIARRHLPSARSATNSAIPIATASLANSDGWIDSPPSCTHEREPLIVVPATSTNTSPPTEAR